MLLLTELEQALATEQSLFRAQLMREDVARLRKLQALAASAADEAAFLKAGSRIGWTQGDARTAELGAALEPFLQAFYAFSRGAEDEAGLRAAWQALDRLRMERLLGCLASPLPRPAD
jgi:hypothetical protein